MAIARDTFVGRTDSSGSTATVSYTNSGNALVVYAENNNGTSGVSATYNGVAMTQVDSLLAYAPSAYETSFILLNPSTGTHDIVVSFADAGSHSVMAESYTGVGTGGSTGGCDSHNTTTWSSSSSNQTIATTTVADNAWITGYFRSSGGTFAAGTNVSIQDNVANIALLFDTGAAITPAGATNQTFTNSGGSNSGGILTVALAPAGGAAAITRDARLLTLLGVG